MGLTKFPICLTVFVIIAAVLFKLFLPPGFDHNKILQISTTYASRRICGSVFHSGRTLEDAKNDISDIDIGILPNVTVDYANLKVKSTLFGFETTAEWVNQFIGCVIHPFTKEMEESLKKIKIEKNYEQFQLVYAKIDAEDLYLGDKNFEESKLSPQKIKRLDEYLERVIMDHDWKQTRAIVITHNGKIIGEKYKKGFSSSTRLLGWSMNKSITSALIGIRIRQGKLTLNETLSAPEWKNNENFKDHAKITIDSLLRMSSGLSFQEKYHAFGQATAMLFSEPSAASFAAMQPVLYPIDTVWYYSSGSTNLLCRKLRETFDDMRDYWEFPKKELFDKIGMKSMILETDSSGIFVGSSFGYATARDWNKFGLLYLNDGVWNGERILPEGWVKYSTTPTSSSPNGHYGAQWWLNSGGLDKEQSKPLPKLPNDVFFAHGYEQQFTLVVPSKKLVITRLSYYKADVEELMGDLENFINQILRILQ